MATPGAAGVAHCGFLPSASGCRCPIRVNPQLILSLARVERIVARVVATRSTLYDLPELAMRFGLFNRVELRTFWQGQTSTQTQSRPGGPWRLGGGLSDMEIGFKWQLLTHDKERKWVPTTALITSIYTPTGGTSVLGSLTVEPYVNLPQQPRRGAPGNLVGLGRSRRSTLLDRC
ncbi:MAG TPA: hypothetical protein VKF17_11750 [Isosphaeraceae bacterium]|nr:hypothetical protein [Isosphaeraceae bacterium]